MITPTDPDHNRNLSSLVVLAVGVVATLVRIL
jgi:hypothetical protein